MKKLPLMALAILAFYSCGCGFPLPMASSKGSLGEATIKVKPSCMVIIEGRNGNSKDPLYYFKCGNTAAYLRDQLLVVNGYAYGTVKAGDAILIDQEEVSVNGAERAATALTEQQKDRFPGNDSTTEKELAGRTVTIKPGSFMATTATIDGRATLTVGKVKVAIHPNGALFVNGASYGTVPEEAHIKVTDGNVYIDGTLRPSPNIDP